MAGAIPVIPFDGTVDAEPQVVKLRGLQYTMTVSFALPRAQAVAATNDAPVAAVVFGDAGRDYAGPIAGALVIALGMDEVLVAGTGVSVAFAPDGPDAPKAGIISAEEGHYADGKWVTDRWMNGNQTDQGRRVRLESSEFTIQRVRLYRYR